MWLHDDFYGDTPSYMPMAWSNHWPREQSWIQSTFNRTNKYLDLIINIVFESMLNISVVRLKFTNLTKVQRACSFPIFLFHFFFFQFWAIFSGIIQITANLNKSNLRAIYSLGGKHWRPACDNFIILQLWFGGFYHPIL